MGPRPRHLALVSLNQFDPHLRDGGSHDFDSRLKGDQRRDAWLLSQGYAVLRFTNEQVLKELEGVVSVIRATAIERIRGAPPSLSLPHKGGGNPQTVSLPVAAKSIRGSRP